VGETRSSRVRAAVAASRARPMRTKGIDAVEEATAYASRPAGRATIMRVTRSLAKVERGMACISYRSSHGDRQSWKAENAPVHQGSRRPSQAQEVVDDLLASDGWSRIDTRRE
jgi:hypothetical protein